MLQLFLKGLFHQNDNSNDSSALALSERKYRCSDIPKNFIVLIKCIIENSTSALHHLQLGGDANVEQATTNCGVDAALHAGQLFSFSN